MHGYIDYENVGRYPKLSAISEGDPRRDEARHQTLLRLPAEEMAREVEPKDLPDARDRGRP